MGIARNGTRVGYNRRIPHWMDFDGMRVMSAALVVRGEVTTVHDQPTL